MAVLDLDASSSGATAGQAGLDAESGAGGDHRRLAAVDGGDGVVDALQMDGRNPEVGMAQLALDDVERDALVGELDGVGVAQLVGRKPPSDAGLGGDAPQ